MHRILLVIATLACLSFVGCADLAPRDNLSPEMKQKLDKLEGNQNTLENNQNAIKLELGRLQNHLKVEGDNNDLQQGWLNVKADGIVIAVFAITTIGMLLFYMYRSQKYKQMAEIMGDQIKTAADPDIKERVMAAAWNTGVEKDIFRIIE